MQPQLKKKNTFDKDRSRYSNFENDRQSEQHFEEPSIKNKNTFNDVGNFNNFNGNVNENMMPQKGYQQSNNGYNNSITITDINQNTNQTPMMEEDNYKHKHKGKGGLILIAIGILFILQNIFGYNVFSMSKLWPAFVLIPGLAFEFGYFSTRREPGLLVPGGILTTIGALFFFETFTNWIFAGYTWPVYILSVAVGLFQLYIFGGRKKALLVPVFILTSLFLIFIATTTLHALAGSLLLPVVLIGLGISRLLKK